jgi:hypothetical protein
VLERFQSSTDWHSSYLNALVPFKLHIYVSMKKEKKVHSPGTESKGFRSGLKRRKVVHPSRKYEEQWEREEKETLARQICLYVVHEDPSHPVESSAPIHFYAWPFRRRKFKTDDLRIHPSPSEPVDNQAFQNPSSETPQPHSLIHRLQIVPSSRVSGW